MKLDREDLIIICQPPSLLPIVLLHISLVKELGYHYPSSLPANMSLFEPYILTPLDHLERQIFIPYFVSFSTTNPSEAAKALELGVTKMVTHLPFLTGNVIRSWQGEGAIANATSICPASSSMLQQSPMLQVKYHTFQGRHAPDSERSLQNIISDKEYTPTLCPPGEPQPVLRLQANVVESGIILCITFNHRFVDAGATAIVLMALAECCRDSWSLPLSRATQRLGWEHLSHRPSATGIPCPVEYSHLDAQTVEGLDERTISERFVLSWDRVEGLKKACSLFVQGNMVQPGQSASKYLLSSNDIVTALVWICAARARHGVSATMNTSLSFTIDARSLPGSQIPKTYIGNALVKGYISSTDSCMPIPLGNMPSANIIPDKLVPDARTIAEAALRIRKQILSTTADYTDAILSRVMDYSDWTSLHPRIADFQISGMRQIPIFRLDFGPHLGRMRDLDYPGPPWNGGCWINPAKGRQAPWEIRVRLERSSMNRLKKQRIFDWVQLGDLSLKL